MVGEKVNLTLVRASFYGAFVSVCILRVKMPNLISWLYFFATGAAAGGAAGDGGEMVLGCLLLNLAGCFPPNPNFLALISFAFRSSSSEKNLGNLPPVAQKSRW